MRPYLASFVFLTFTQSAFADNLKILECNTQGSSSNYSRICLYDIIPSEQKVKQDNQPLPGFNPQYTVINICNKLELKNELVVSVLVVRNKKLHSKNAFYLKGGYASSGSNSSNTAPIPERSSFFYEGTSVPNLKKINRLTFNAWDASLDFNPQNFYSGKVHATLSANGTPYQSGNKFVFSKSSLYKNVNCSQETHNPEASEESDDEE